MNSYSVDPALAAEALVKARTQGSVSADLLTWVAVHGNLQLALRHPLNAGASRPLIEQFITQLGQWLVEQGMLTPEHLAEAERREAQFQRWRTTPLPPPEES
jgi:hypothetical protein